MRHIRFLPDDTNINFIGWRYYAFAADGILLLIAIVSIALQGFNLGIDFSGGVELEVKSAHVIDLGSMRSTIDSLGFGQSQLQNVGSGVCNTPVNSCVLIRVQPKADQSGLAVIKAIKAKLGPSYDFRRDDIVGPSVSRELFYDGVKATILAIV